MSNTERIAKQKSVADEVLDALSILNPQVIVAGGAPGDWHLGNPARDIDVFIEFPRRLQGQSRFLETLGKLISGDIKIVTRADGTEYKMNSDVSDVYEISHPSGETVQVVRLEENGGQNCIAKFPLPTSQATYSKSGVVWVSRELLVSHAWKILWAEAPYALGHPYTKKIIAKFPGYRFLASKSSAYEHIVNTELRNKVAA